jgi:hypothetical protein
VAIGKHRRDPFGHGEREARFAGATWSRQGEEPYHRRGQQSGHRRDVRLPADEWGERDWQTLSTIVPSSMRAHRRRTPCRGG